MLDWEGRVALITGASSGIGAALAQALSRRGVFVALVARRVERLHEVARLCPTESKVFPCDLTAFRTFDPLVRQVLAWKGRIDILVNNAGLGIYKPFEEVTTNDLKAVFGLNFFAVFFLIQAVLPVMRKQGEGWILNIASTGGLIAHTAGVTPYLAAKHAVVGMSRGLRKELEGTGIHIQVVCPHLTRTEFFNRCLGAERMQGWIVGLYEKMDSPEQVAEGIVEQLGTEQFILFPTPSARKAYERFKDL